MKVIIFAVCLFCFSFVPFQHTYAQTIEQKSFAKDTTPIEDLDYHLSKDEFMYYYGTDDTARAIINMFYRKRGVGILDFLVYPIGFSSIGAGAIGIGAILSLAETSTAIATVFVAGGVAVYIAGAYGIPIYYLVQRANFSRQKLIYALVGRERGMGIPDQVFYNLRERDFR